MNNQHLPTKFEKPTQYFFEEITDDMEDYNDEDENGNSTLIFAVSHGKEELARALIDHGASVNHQNNLGETALYWAASQGFENIVDLLIENGANLNICTLDGATPIHIAAANGHCNIISKLVKNGAFVNAQDEENDTPLHYAVREGNQNAVEFLVRFCNARIDLKNEDLETPLDLAFCLESNCVGSYPQIVKVLTSSSSSFNEDISKNMHSMNLNKNQFGHKIGQFNMPIF